MKLSNFFLSILISVFLVSTIVFSANDEIRGEDLKEIKKKKGAKNWNKIKYDDLEKEWEKGDDKEELEHEYDRIKKINDKKKPKINMNADPKILAKQLKEVSSNANSNGGSSMVFVDLHSKQLDGSEWSKKSVDDLCSRWAALIQSAALSATVYNIDKHNVLLNIEKGWMVNDVLKFASKQPETESFSVNSKKYLPKEFLSQFDDDYDEDEL